MLKQSKSQEDIKNELNKILLNNENKLKPNLITLEGPNSKQQISFGGTIKMKNTIEIEKSDINSNIKDIENWKLYNEVGQTIPRSKVAKTYGKLLDNPGPGEYTPDLNILSTSEPSYKFSLHSRTYYEPVDRLDTPGPGTYRSPSGIRKEIERFRKDPVPEATPPKQKVGPGTYTPNRTVEYGKFHREICAIMPKRDEGTLRRATVDLHTLYVHKSKKKQSNIKELPNSHLGPGTYFHPSENNIPVTNPLVDLTATGKKKWKIESNRTKYYDCDPMTPTPSYFTIGERRKDGALITDPCPPGPGSYSPDRSLFGSNNLLSEGGGAVTRPGKLCLNTSASEGIISGQHASAIYSLPIKKSTSKLISTIKVVDPQTDKVHTVTAKWKENNNHNNNNHVNKPTSSHKIYHNAGRGTESSVQDRNYTFRGRNSPGTFLRFG